MTSPKDLMFLSDTLVSLALFLVYIILLNVKWRLERVPTVRESDGIFVAWASKVWSACDVDNLTNCYLTHIAKILLDIIT